MIKVKIEPYNNDMGVFWRVVNVDTKEVVDDGFESTADAEMWCSDNDYEYTPTE